MTSDRILIIIPSTRNPSVVLSYIQNARENGFDLGDLHFLILTEDFIDKGEYSNIFHNESVYGVVMNQTDRERMMEELHVGDFTDVFPKRSHAETSYGLFYMYLKKYDYGIFIDDDTLPLSDVNYFWSHLRNLKSQDEISCIGSDKKWVNVLNHSFHKHRLYPRGYPYSAIGEKAYYKKKRLSNVVASQGLWTNIPDLDAVRILMDGDLNCQAKTRLSQEDYGENFVVDKGNFVTICSMNLAFKSVIVPAFYQFKMDDNPWKIGRFDDIWSGVVIKKISDSMDWDIVNGNPLCEHNKAARSTFKDLRSEVPGLEANERFYQIIDSTEFSDTDIFKMSEEIADKMTTNSDDFVSFNGKLFLRWLALLRKVS